MGFWRERRCLLKSEAVTALWGCNLDPPAHARGSHSSLLQYLW